MLKVIRDSRCEYEEMVVVGEQELLKRPSRTTPQPYQQFGNAGRSLNPFRVRLYPARARTSVWRHRRHQHLRPIGKNRPENAKRTKEIPNLHEGASDRMIYCTLHSTKLHHWPTMVAEFANHHPRVQSSATNQRRATVADLGPRHISIRFSQSPLEFSSFVRALGSWPRVHRHRTTSDVLGTCAERPYHEVHPKNLCQPARALPESKNIEAMRTKTSKLKMNSWKYTAYQRFIKGNCENRGT